MPATPQSSYLQEASTIYKGLAFSFSETADQECSNVSELKLTVAQSTTHVTSKRPAVSLESTSTASKAYTPIRVEPPSLIPFNLSIKLIFTCAFNGSSLLA